VEDGKEIVLERERSMAGKWRRCGGVG